MAAARAPAIVERNGVRYGFLQRSSVYWPTNHEAGANATGIAVIRAHTAYQVPMHKTRPDIPPMNRPGIPPVIITWADPDYLREFTEDIAALRAKVDILVASCHWGLHKEVLAYMREIGRAAIDAGADLVIGHGPHYSLPIEVYRGKSIFYGLGSFSFHTGHGGRRHGDWIGMMVRATVTQRTISTVGFQFVRHNDDNETILRRPADERANPTTFEGAASNTVQSLPSMAMRRWSEPGVGPVRNRPRSNGSARAVSALGWRIQIDLREDPVPRLRNCMRHWLRAGRRAVVGEHVAAGIPIIGARRAKRRSGRRNRRGGRVGPGG